MRHLPSIAAPLAAAGLLIALAAPAAAQSSDRIARTFSQEFERAGHRAWSFDLNVGELEVVGAATERINVEVSVRCSSDAERERCRDRAEDVALVSSERGGRLSLTIEGTGMWRARDASVRVRLTVPEDMTGELIFGTGEISVENIAGDLRVEMDIGEAVLQNIRGNLVVDMGIGEISVTMPQDVVGEVTLDNGIGETELRHREGRNAMEGLLGGTDVHWDNGTGPKTVKIDLNVGEIRVRLD